MAGNWATCCTGRKSVPNCSSARQNLEWSEEVELNPSFSFDKSFSLNSAEWNSPGTWDTRWRQECNYSSDWCFHQYRAIRWNSCPLRKLWLKYGPRDMCKIHTVAKVGSTDWDREVLKATLCQNGCSVWRWTSSPNCLWRYAEPGFPWSRSNFQNWPGWKDPGHWFCKCHL